MANRHLSRSIILQALFEWDFQRQHEKDEKVGEKELLKILNRHQEKNDELDLDFIQNITKSLFSNLKKIDDLIKFSAPDWPILKINLIDRNILRLAITELAFNPFEKIPSKVAINEAVELAKDFGGDTSYSFVNGALGAIYDKLLEEGEIKEDNKN